MFRTQEINMGGNKRIPYIKWIWNGVGIRYDTRNTWYGMERDGWLIWNRYRMDRIQEMDG